MKRVSLIISALLAATLSANCALHPKAEVAPHCAGMVLNLSTAQQLCAA
jgi:hypothetical protein